MNLILSGGGNSEQSVGVDTLFTSLLKNNKILYIPIAMDRIKHSDEECLAWLNQNFSPYGKFEITLVNEGNIKDIEYKNILEYGGIFIGGGNTFKLLKILKDTQFDKYLVRLLKETDIPVIGGSAGAVIFAKDIETVKTIDVNKVKLDDLSGMNMLNGKNIWVHYHKNMDNEIIKYVKRTGVDVIAVSEDAGLYVTEKGVFPIGDVKIFNLDQLSKL